MIIVDPKDDAGFLVEILGDHRIELKKLTAIFDDRQSNTLKQVIEFGLRSLLKHPYK